MKIVNVIFFPLTLISFVTFNINSGTYKSYLNMNNIQLINIQNFTTKLTTWCFFLPLNMLYSIDIGDSFTDTMGNPAK